jgi:hypothetical protein
VNDYFGRTNNNIRYNRSERDPRSESFTSRARIFSRARARQNEKKKGRPYPAITIALPDAGLGICERLITRRIWQRRLDIMIAYLFIPNDKLQPLYLYLIHRDTYKAASIVYTVETIH